jgi:hypothetical protein
MNIATSNQAEDSRRSDQEPTLREHMLLERARGQESVVPAKVSIPHGKAASQKLSPLNVSSLSISILCSKSCDRDENPWHKAPEKLSSGHA